MSRMGIVEYKKVVMIDYIPYYRPDHAAADLADIWVNCGSKKVDELSKGYRSGTGEVSSTMLLEGQLKAYNRAYRLYYKIFENYFRN